MCLDDLSDDDLRWLILVADGLNPEMPDAVRDLLISARLIEAITPSVVMVSKSGKLLLDRAFETGRLRRANYRENCSARRGKDRAD